MTPHHYLPGSDLPRVIRQGDSFKVIPRTLEEKALDGRTYSDLTLRVDMPPGRLLVVGLYWPWSNPTVVNYVQQAQDAETSADERPRGDPPTTVLEPMIESVDDLPEYAPPPPIAHHLGRVLFTGARMGEPLQMLLVIGVD